MYVYDDDDEVEYNRRTQHKKNEKSELYEEREKKTYYYSTTVLGQQMSCWALLKWEIRMFVGDNSNFQWLSLPDFYLSKSTNGQH